MVNKYRKKTLNSIDQKVLLTSFFVGSTSPIAYWKPILLNNFPGSETGDTLLADAVVFSGAMPGMFGSYKGNVDGAFVHHDPTLAAIALAVAAGIRLSDIVAICFGTGFMRNTLGSESAGWGAQQWQQGDPERPNYHLQPLLINGTISPILNISLNGTSTNLRAPRKIF
ncbi:MAG: hypothetical protein DLM68_18115, partial [Hyphomicrobiales bacterium]